MSSFKFEWKANRNFCVTTMDSCDFECQECDDARDNGTFHEFVLKLEHTNLNSLQPSTFRLIGYFKTQENADKALGIALETGNCGECVFIFNRAGEIVDGSY